MATLVFQRAGLSGGRYTTVRLVLGWLGLAGRVGVGRSLTIVARYTTGPLGALLETCPIGRGDRRLPAHFDGLIRSLPDP